MEGINVVMERNVTIDEAKYILGDNFIGPTDLEKCDFLQAPDYNDIPIIPFSNYELEKKKDEYLLIYSVDHMNDGEILTIRNMIKRFGKNPDEFEPCFYNQDWYDNEDFIDVSMKKGWYLIRKNVYEESRAVLPEELQKKYNFPNAVTCVYSFFVLWKTRNVKLWYLDFVWCADVDHNGDRIYVGKYHDIDGINKNGFSIHRHLALRPCYGCID